MMLNNLKICLPRTSFGSYTSQTPVEAIVAIDYATGGMLTCAYLKIEQKRERLLSPNSTCSHPEKMKLKEKWSPIYDTANSSVSDALSLL